METLAAQLATRHGQWARFQEWERHEDPVRLMDREEGFRWACELHEWFVGRFGYPQRIAQAQDFEGIRLMRSRLALFTTKV